jgi:hypothetical protein
MYARRIANPHWNVRYNDDEQAVIIKCLGIALAIDEGEEPPELTEEEAELAEKVRDINAEQWDRVFNDDRRHSDRQGRFQQRRYANQG